MSILFRLGVVIVTFNSRDVIAGCLESLLSSGEAEGLEIIVVDNASTDDTVDVIAEWARTRASNSGALLEQTCESQQLGCTLVVTAERALTVLRSNVNGGYAYGVNRGIEYFLDRTDIAAFWVLNPDCVVPPHTPGMFRHFALTHSFGLASSRCLFLDDKETIQTDGGNYSRLTGVCRSVNARKRAAETPLPDGASLDFVSGANMLVSRNYVSSVGLMTEDYFLYYEEVDWAHRRGELALRLIAGAEIYHKGGTSIGSGSLHTQPTSFANYFNNRSRMRFVRRFLRPHYAIALVWSFAKCLQVAFKAGLPQAVALVRGALELSPPPAIRRRIADPAAQARAFGRLS